MSLQNLPSLDPGEIEAISLALEVEAAAILIDERRGRKVARSMGLVVAGTVGVLELAAGRALVDLPSALASLGRTKIFLTPRIYQDALERDRLRRG